MPPPTKADSDHRTRALLRMWLTPGLGLAGCHRLLAETRNPADVFGLAPKDLERLSIRPEAAAALLSPRSLERAEEEWMLARSLGIRILGLDDPVYPSLLKETFDPPIVLYVRESGWDPDRPHIAIVGTRRPSPYGLHAAERLAADLAGAGLVVVSGLARGIDTAAHRGALSTGRTLAVLGTGMDRTYPAENRELADSIAGKGALLSEFPLGTLPLPQNFPLRNRVLAGLTLGTVVVEAKERSGSLITARLAADANREVFAVPGPIDQARSAGPHRLIRDGACLVTRWEDVVEELPSAIRQHLAVPTDAATKGASKVSSPQRKVLEVLSPSEATAIDCLLSKVDLTPSEIYAALLDLELGGLVRRHSGDRYRLSPLAAQGMTENLKE